jgi:thiol-disulfide isomerase/thioredoxin
MKWITLIAFWGLFGLNTYAQEQEIKTYSFSSLDEKIQQERQKQVVLVNFWATWCKPCIEELPYFEALGKDMQDVKVMLVSLDMEKERAEKYAQKKQLQAEVLYLDEVDFNSWIDQISPDWSGAIPATLMVAPEGQQAFFEGSFTQDELYETVNRFIKNSQ